MRSRVDLNVAGQSTGLRFLRAASLDEAQLERWREFAEHMPWAHYLQDPAWAEIERRGRGWGSRQPFFFWAELDGAICLTALGVRRSLPIPGRFFWEFKNGPTVLDGSVLEAWLPWLDRSVGRTAARLQIQPAMVLDDAGDDVETLLDRHDFVRRRALGIWATLTVDLQKDESAILASFRPRVRAEIRKSTGLGIAVRAEDHAAGWTALSALDAEMAHRTPVQPIDERSVASISRHWMAGGSGGSVLVARHEGEPLAATLLVVYRGTAHLRMMPSTRRHGKLPASHLLLWEAIRWAKRQGCTTFDLDGYTLTAPPADALWGVNLFKRGFAPIDQLSKFVAIHERVFSPVIVAAARRIRRFQARQRHHVEGQNQ
jgi:Acetyltransferase (GNAT) domain